MFKELSKTLQAHPTASFLSSLRSCRFANKFHSTFNRKLIYFWGNSLSFTTFFSLFNVHTDAKKKKQSPNTGTQIWHPEESIFFSFILKVKGKQRWMWSRSQECANDFLGPAGSFYWQPQLGAGWVRGEQRPRVKEDRISLSMSLGCLAVHHSVKVPPPGQALETGRHLGKPGLLHLHWLISPWVHMSLTVTLPCLLNALHHQHWSPGSSLPNALAEGEW